MSMLARLAVCMLSCIRNLCQGYKERVVMPLEQTLLDLHEVLVLDGFPEGIEERD